MNFLSANWPTLEALLAGCGRNSGQTLVEYALILAVVSVVIVVLLTAVGDSIQNIFQTIIDSFEAGV